ncbi:uncharacterized protein LOC133366814 isoform X3 [Rhineura floridana]|uniref:uncharacterized protein LOC133366814 isoform X3 n=1 Tax=Rhineura floridana TaxID=261503 RepID=UPI002AC83AEA|nr:uncharacterized protein LOC133366814 isoform X3 [Rhineura floridana]
MGLMRNQKEGSGRVEKRRGMLKLHMLELCFFKRKEVIPEPIPVLIRFMCYLWKVCWGWEERSRLYSACPSLWERIGATRYCHDDSLLNRNKVGEDWRRAGGFNVPTSLRKGHNREFQRLPLDVAIHQYQPGDWVRVRKWKQQPLQPTWGPPEQIILITESAVKLVGHKRWVHASRIKKAEPVITEEPEKGVAKDSPPGEAKDQTPEEKWLSETIPGFNLKLKLKKQKD